MKARKELKEFRTPNSKRFLNKDGTIQVELYKEPIHYKSDDGQYEEIDNTFEETTTGVKNKRNDFIVEFDEKNEKCLLNISSKGHKLCMYPKKIKGKQRDKKSTKGTKNRRIDRVKYEGILDNTDIEYELHSKCLKESIVLHEKPKNNIIEFILKTDLELSVDTDNSIYISNGKEKIFKLEKPFMIDNKKSYSESIKYEIEKNKNEYEIRMVLDKEWINSKNREYPIIIDPTITGIEESDSVIDTYIFSGDESTTTHNQDKILVGSLENSTSYRGLLKFNLPNIPSSYVVTDAKLFLNCYIDSSDDELPDNPLIVVHEVTQEWDNSSAKWENIYNKYATHIYDYFYANRTKIDNYQEENEITSCVANITGLVQKWYNGEPNYGIMLKQFEEQYLPNGKIGTFYSSDTFIEGENILKPKIVLTYKDYNGVHNYDKFVSKNHFLGNTIINLFTGNAFTTFSVGNTVGSDRPINLSLSCNSADIVNNKNYGYGLGFKINLYQTLKFVTIEGEEYLIYLDENSREHYFYQDGAVYYDEDGLNLKIIVNNDHYVMQDLQLNEYHFENIDSEILLTKIKDTQGKEISINYNNGMICSLEDSDGQIISIIYNENSIEIVSPYKTIYFTLENNRLVKITEFGDEVLICYGENNLIQSIVNPDNTKVNLIYKEGTSNKVKRILEIGNNGNEGNFFDINYDFKSTTIKDRNNVVNTFSFDEQGRCISMSNLEDDTDLKNGFGKSFTFYDENNVHELNSNNNLIKYVKNFINDSSFENNTENIFDSYGINTYTLISNDNGRSGNNALEVTIPNPPNYIYKEFNMEKGHHYTFSMYIKSNGVEEVNIDLKLAYDETETKTKITKLDSEYKRYSINIYYPLEATGNLKVVIQNSGEGIISFTIDDIQLEEGEIANYYNLFDNSDFSNDIIDWEIESTKDIGTQTNPNRQELIIDEIVSLTPSLKALNIKGSPLVNKTLTKRFNINGKKGDTFNLSFWYKNEGITTTDYTGWIDRITAFIWFNYVDSDEGTCVSTIPLQMHNNNWQYFSENFTADFDYNDIKIVIFSFNNANNCYVTNFSLFKDLSNYKYYYDDKGNVVSLKDQNNRITSVSYNNSNQIIKELEPLGNAIYREYDKYVHNRLIGGRSSNGIETKVIYNSAGKPIKNIVKNTSLQNQEKKCFIREKGTRRYFYVNSNKSIGFKSSECSYDKFIIIPNEETIKIKYAILPNYYINIINDEVTLSYNQGTDFVLEENEDKSICFNIANTSKYLAVSENVLIVSELNEGITYKDFYLEDSTKKLFLETSVSYTEDGKFINSTVDALGNSTQYQVNSSTGLVEKKIMPNGNEITYNYNDKLQITNIYQGDKSVSYEYVENKLDRITLNSKIYTINYDEFNKEKEIKLNGNLLLKNIYQDNNGNLQKVLYGNNNEIEYQYDNFNRIKNVLCTDKKYIHYYDNLNRLTKIIEGNNIWEYLYDFSQRLKSYKYNNYNSEFEYNDNEKLIKKIDQYGNNKNTINYEYNDDGVVTQMSFENNVVNSIYDELGRLYEKNINESLRTRYHYISNGNKTSLRINEVEDSDNKYHYKYDLNGNILEIEKDNVLIKKYEYDEHNQLIYEENIDENYCISYVINNSNNIIKETKKEIDTNQIIVENIFEYNSTSNEDLLTKYNDLTIDYDSIGNPIQIGNSLLNWENGHELVKYINDKDNLLFEYDVNGIRTKKIVNGIEQNYYYEGNKLIYEKRNNSLLYYLYNSNDELIGFVYNNNTYFYHKNLFNDIIGIYDNIYNEIVSYKYDSYGKLIELIDNSSQNIGTINPFRYRSYYYDIETDLYYLVYRYYNADWHRFLSPDVVISTGQDITGYNQFLYSGNNPINRTDEAGEVWFQVAGAVFGATIGAVTKIVTNKIEGKEDIMEGVGAAALGGAVSGVLSTTTFGIAHPVIAASVSSAVESLTNEITDEEDGINWGRVGLETIKGAAIEKVTGNYWNTMKIDKNWIKPTKISTSFFGKYQTKININRLYGSAQTIVMSTQKNIGSAFAEVVNPKSCSSVSNNGGNIDKVTEVAVNRISIRKIFKIIDFFSKKFIEFLKSR